MEYEIEECIVEPDLHQGHDAAGRCPEKRLRDRKGMIIPEESEFC